MLTADVLALPRVSGPLLTLELHELLIAAVRAGRDEIECSLDLQRTRSRVEVASDHWRWNTARYPYLETCKDRTVYFWDGACFQVAARFSGSLIKLVPTQWGAPTFEIDGIKMLPSAQASPFVDAQRKVALVQPRGKSIFDTCGGLGYFAASCLEGGAHRVVSYEKNPDVIWLRTMNPWSPESGLHRDPRYELEVADVAAKITALPAESFDAALHDPPRFGIAGELYSQRFYDELARVLKRKARLFHYTGTPNKLTSGRDVPNEVANRLRRAGFATELKLDGVLATKQSRARIIP
jgi:predicted methyltransferase